MLNFLTAPSVIGSSLSLVEWDSDCSDTTRILPLYYSLLCSCIQTRLTSSRTSYASAAVTSSGRYHVKFNLPLRTARNTTVIMFVAATACSCTAVQLVCQDSFVPRGSFQSWTWLHPHSASTLQSSTSHRSISM